MKLSEPIGKAEWGALIVRVAVGVFFVMKGLHEIDRVPLALQPVGHLAHFSEKTLLLFSLLIPYFELAAGTLLVVGFWTTIGAVVASAVGLFLVYVVGALPTKDMQLLNPLVVVLAGALSLLYTGAGPFSVDKFRKGSGGAA